MKKSFDYYYGAQADQFSFIRIPKVMLTEQTFAGLSMQSKVLYGVLLDRMSLSRKNGWFDEENKVFIIYQIGEIQKDFGFSKKKAMELLSELENFGLLEKKRRGHGLPNILYVKSFMSGIAENSSEAASGSSQSEPDTAGSGTDAEPKDESRGAETGTSGQKSTGSRTSCFRTSRVPKSAPLEVPDRSPLEVRISGPLKSNTDINKTEGSHIESNHINDLPVSAGSRSGPDRWDTMRYDKDPLTALADNYQALICENIEYDNLLLTFPQRRELIEGIMDLILETLLCRSEEILIASTRFPAAIVRSRLLKLNYSHIVYVVNCLEGNTTKVKNIRKYLLASLYNAPTTIDGYYTAEVNHDLAVAR